MSDVSAPLVIHTGSDPRERPEFTALREEINKINHPARPEMNWRLIESLALTLFRNHGVDLQTAVYYTLARTHQQGLAGFTEGTELLAGLVVSQWEVLWPEQANARSDILEWFTARVGSALRQHDVSGEPLRLVYRAERALQLLNDKLQQVALKRVPRIDNLLYFMQNTAKRLEAAQGAGSAPGEAALPRPSMVYLSVPDTARETPQQNIEVRFMPPPPPKPSWTRARWGFAAGVLLSLAAVSGLYFSQLTPPQQQLKALAATPEGAVQLWLAAPQVASYGSQLSQLENLSPLAALRTADRSVALARQLWPSDGQQQAESQRWERLLQARHSSDGAENSYYQLQQRLNALSATLLEQEKSRGSVTLSYLKTEVYQMQNSLTQGVPLEELLRQMAVALEQQSTVSPLLIKQIDARWAALLSRYHALTLQAEAVH